MPDLNIPQALPFVVIALAMVLRGEALPSRGAITAGRLPAAYAPPLVRWRIVAYGLFIAFGLIALFKRPDVTVAFKPMFPKGFGGVIAAMGLTFIAFEGYDLIATVS